MPSIATVIGVLSASVGHALESMAQGGQGHTDELFQTHIGGSAVLEGVMMRGRNGWAVSVREESGGIYVEERPLPGPEERPAWQKLPIVRGCVSFVESMRISYQALSIAVDHVYEDAPAEPGKAARPHEAIPPIRKVLSARTRKPPSARDVLSVPGLLCRKTLFPPRGRRSLQERVPARAALPPPPPRRRACSSLSAWGCF